VTVVAAGARYALAPLTYQVAALAAPCRRNKHEDQICAEVDAWATELVDARGARFGEMASRAFPETGKDSVVLFGQWLAWLFAFDDRRDDGPLGRDVRTTDRLYATVLSGRGDPLALAFRDLWQATEPRTTPGWQVAFRGHMDQHRAACRAEARFRLAGRPPSPAEYAALRRRANGPFMFDLAEPILGVRLPDGLRRTTAWQTMLSACNDVTAWCNDIASIEKEQAYGDVLNFVLVLAYHNAMEPAAAADLVLARIAERIEDLRGAAQDLPMEFRKNGLTQKESRDAAKVAVTLLGAPRGHLEWLLETDRYDTDSAIRRASFMSATPSSR
jgi:hypothetical protein